MTRLLQLLFRYRFSVVFVLLELTSISFIFSRERHQLSSSWVMGQLLNFIDELRIWPLLKKENERLLQDNAALRKQLLQKEAFTDPSCIVVPASYDFIPARVISNSIIGAKNYLTLNKGAINGVAPGMGVISTSGMVGIVKAVSDHFSTVISLLHTSMQVSAKILNSAVLGTVQWPGKNPSQAQMLYVPRHVQVESGHTVVTSGYNSAFFEGTVIGQIKQVTLRQGAPFYDIELILSTDFSTLQYVYIIKHTLKKERDDLEQYTQKFYE